MLFFEVYASINQSIYETKSATFLKQKRKKERIWTDIYIYIHIRNVEYATMLLCRHATGALQPASTGLTTMKPLRLE